MSRIHNLISFVIFTFLFFSAVFGQDGKIEGYIFDSQYNEPLPGANIYLEGTSYGAAADLNGKYTILGVPAGDYQLIIKYIGYQDKTIDITVGAGETVEQVITLDFQSLEGEVIEVTAQAEGQMQAINQQLSSNTISNVVSKSRIQEVPDVNAAESIGRLPGVSINRSGGEATQVTIRGLSPKYNTVTVNGVRVPATGAATRAADLSLISSTMLEGIEVKKAVTPDMDADALGGSVDLKLRRAPESFKANASLLGGYNQLQDKFGNYNFNASVSNRFLDGQLGVIAGFNTDSYDRSADKFQASYRIGNKVGTQIKENIITNLNLREEIRTRGRLGGNLIMDYYIPNGKVLFSSFYNQLSTDGGNRVYDYALNAGRLNYEIETVENTTSIFTGDLGFEQDFDWIKYDASFALSSSRSKSPDNYYWRFVRENGGIDTTFGAGTDPLIIPDHLVPDSLITAFADAYLRSTDRSEDQSTFQLNVQVPFNFFDISGYLKTGAKFRWLDRMNDQNRDGRNGLNYGSTDLEDLAISANPQWQSRDGVSAQELTDQAGWLPAEVFRKNYNRKKIVNGDYPIGYTFNETWLKQLTNTLIDSGESLHYSIDSRGQDYDGIERFQAGYIMAEFNYGNEWSLIPGIRMESDYSKYHGQSFRETTVNNTEGPPSDLDTLTNVRRNTFWLPMVHLKYEPFDWIKIRLARTETLTRPDFNQYAPITSFNSYQTYMRASNGHLKPAHSTNLDASVSVYENHVGLFTASVFNKEIDDLIFQTRYTFNRGVPIPEGFNIPEKWLIPPSGPPPAPDADLYINNKYTANYHGVELDWQTHFWYLPSYLSGLVLSVNYTRLFSKTRLQFFSTQEDSTYLVGRFPVTVYKVVDTSKVIRMPDQPGHIANVTLGYDYKGFSIRLSYLYQADNLIWPSDLDIEEIFSDEYSRWDMTLQQRFTENIQVFANFTNFNNTPDRNLRGRHTREPQYIEYYGFTWDVGMRYRF